LCREEAGVGTGRHLYHTAATTEDKPASFSSCRSDKQGIRLFNGHRDKASVFVSW